MKALLFTNREKNTKSSKEERKFIERARGEGARTTVMAHLDRHEKDYRVELIENSDSNDNASAETRIREIERFMRECIDNEYSCVLYVHGYGKTFEESIMQAVELRNRYHGVGVMAFSWPSVEKTGSVKKEYEAVQRVAEQSIGALSRIFTDIKAAKDRLPAGSSLSVNLLIHSLGNYLFAHLIDNEPEYDLRIFDNIIHSAPDVDIRTHVPWMKKVKPAKGVYITANKSDSVLLASQILHTPDGEADDRLGDSLHVFAHSGLRAPNAVYIDFSKGKNVGFVDHQLFGNYMGGWFGKNEQYDNFYVYTFFARAFAGKKFVHGEAFVKDDQLNCYQLKK